MMGVGQKEQMLQSGLELNYLRLKPSVMTLIKCRVVIG